jgi:hypothetical protein
LASPIIFCASQSCKVYKHRNLSLSRVGREKEVKLSMSVSQSSRLASVEPHHQNPGATDDWIMYLKLVFCERPLVMLVRRKFFECHVKQQWVSVEFQVSEILGTMGRSGYNNIYNFAK